MHWGEEGEVMKETGEGWGWRRGDRRRGDEGDGRGVGMEERR